jgi:tripartite-type tricarboxylate transporter receptor subunit TctC
MRLLIAAVLALAPAFAWTQAYPSKPVRLIVPFPPGGTSDILARVVAQKMAEGLGQPVVIENRAGASGTIGAAVVAKAAPDGYTLLSGSSGTSVIAEHLYRNLSFDPVKDFQPISRLALVPGVLIVHPTVPAKSVADVIAQARAQPGKLTFASGGPGTIQHLSGELFRHMAKVDMLHVAYKGGAPALNDLLGGQVMMSFEPLPTAVAHIKSGKLRPLGVTTPARIAALPDVPAIAETLPGYELALWFGFMGPARMPREVTQRLNAEVVRAIKSPEVRERLLSQGADPIGDSVDEFAAVLRKESTQWAEFAKATGIKLD